MADKSSKEELKRYKVLKLMEMAGEIDSLVHQYPLSCTINGIEVFKYTPDFRYRELSTRLFIYEEYKGFLRERHDSLLRMKIMSAIRPNGEFRLYEGPGSNAKLTRVYKAGKAVRQMKGRKKK